MYGITERIWRQKGSASRHLMNTRRPTNSLFRPFFGIRKKFGSVFLEQLISDGNDERTEYARRTETVENNHKNKKSGCPKEVISYIHSRNEIIEYIPQRSPGQMGHLD